MDNQEGSTLADDKRREEMASAVAKTPRGFVNQEVFIRRLNLLNSYESQRQRNGSLGYRSLVGQLEIFFLTLEPVYARHEPEKCARIAKVIYSDKRPSLDEIRDILRDLNLFLDKIGVTTLDNYRPGKRRGLED